MQRIVLKPRYLYEMFTNRVEAWERSTDNSAYMFRLVEKLVENISTVHKYGPTQVIINRIAVIFSLKDGIEDKFYEHL